MVESCSHNISIDENDQNISNDENDLKIREEYNLQPNYDFVDRIVNHQDSLYYYIQKINKTSNIIMAYKSDSTMSFKKLKKYLKDYFSNGYMVLSDKFNTYFNFPDTHYHEIVIKSLMKNKKLVFYFHCKNDFHWYLTGIK